MFWYQKIEKKSLVLTIYEYLDHFEMHIKNYMCALKSIFRRRLYVHLFFLMIPQSVVLQYWLDMVENKY